MTISGSTLNVEPANASFGGVVTTAAQTFAGAKTFNGSIVVGVASTTVGSVTFENATNANNTILRSGVATASVTYTLPTDAPTTSGYVLSSTTGGVMSWVSNVSSEVVASKTAAYTIVSETAILAATAGGAFAITLPSAATTGYKITIKKTDTSSNNLTVTAAGADAIDGSASYVLSNPTLKPSVTLISDGGTAWYLV